MRDTYGRVLRAGAVAAAGGLLLAGCSSGGGGEAAKPTPRSPSTGTSAPGTPSPKPTGPDFTPDPQKTPRSAADARRIALATVAGPDDWGPGYVKRAPYLSEPGAWPELDTACTWEVGTLPGTVLYSVTSYGEIPAAGGKGPLRVAATVTIHRSESDADWEMAGTLEEALRCPDQTLREGEHISDLTSLGTPYSVGGNNTTTDFVLERGGYVNDAFKGKQFYNWMQTRLGQVTLATVVKGGPGYTEAETNAAQVRANVIMQDHIKKQLGAQS